MLSAIALGTFDGVHQGHRSVLSLPDGYRKIAVTFKDPPRAVITGNYENIMSCEDKIRVLKNIGTDEIDVLDFNDVRNFPAVEFLLMLYEKYNPAVISCGFNYRFGRDGAGDNALLSEFCRNKRITFQCCEPVTDGGATVSSTLIRELLKCGEIERANRFLSESFSFTAPIIHGDERGRTIGFPTINQRYPKKLVKLKPGVYKSLVTVNGIEFCAVSNIGIRPTYRLNYTLSETYILNFSGNLYDQSITVTPVKFLREEQKFSTIDALKAQIKKDTES